MSNKLLIQESPLMVLPQLAMKIGLNEAIFLQQLHFWLTPTPKYKPHYREWEGKISPWIYNTYEEKTVGDDSTGWCSNFPFWSIATIKRTVKNLKKQNLIITTDKFNTATSNRTLWYTINYDEVDKLEINDTVEGIKMIRSGEYQNDTLMTESTTENTKSVPKKSERPPIIPAYKVYVEIIKKHTLNKPQIQAIDEAIGTDEAALEKWRKVVTAWALKGYNPTNVSGMLEWYTNGIPKYTPNGNGNGRAEKSQPDKIVGNARDGFYL